MVSFESSAEIDGICSLSLLPWFLAGLTFSHVGLSTGLPYDIMAVGFPHEEWSKREVGRANTKTEVTSHPVCHTLFIGSESICPACPHPRKEDYQGMNTKRWAHSLDVHVARSCGQFEEYLAFWGKSSWKVIIRKVLLDVRHRRPSWKGLKESILGYISRTMAQSYPAELIWERISHGPCGYRAQRQFASASPSAKAIPGVLAVSLSN